MSGRVTWIVSMVGVLVVGITVMLIDPLDRYHQAKCKERLRLVGNAIRTYQSEQQGQLPRQFAMLSNELMNPTFLICPGSGHTPLSFTDADSWADYIYVDWSEVGGTNVVPGNYPIAYDRSISYHGGRGVNVLLVDGSVRWDSKGKWLKKFAAEYTNVTLRLPE
jgi:prepilin-type processing-associated H-X9-DG protein